MQENEPFDYKEAYMRRCIELAKHGESGAAPNPMVGAVIVAGDRIIGEGYHARCGGPHAEVNAVQSVREADRPLLRESTLYVSLEPCAHYGKTPPCAELIIRTGIPRVVVGCEDPFARVQGRGIRMLRDAGVAVVTGVLEAECRRLNRRFITFHEKHRPFVTLKWAQSRDGYIDHWRTPGDGEAPARLSTPHSQIAVHHLRARHQAILVGHGTLTLDRPQLTVRAWAERELVKVVLGRVAEGELPAGWQAFADTETLLESLWRQGVQSLLVEGGLRTLQTFIDTGLWDAAQAELSDVLLGSGVPAPRMPRGVETQLVSRFGAKFMLWSNN
ncbi:MAG: bifunctional diaminohydroxyphosphoribosylaminopyrimidine deaminase/5-amino-6-(5-phosphoribosylamino)uracil reductase RibD [Alloprevotella sp.]|nr:bifunctional diaminohydroxyphosphoribosylaminopyrimidine deaminase/5-amino-6-(5-phosphoribosylamino)uracil reductase RibD [Alloprevotella sp.]